MNARPQLRVAAQPTAATKTRTSVNRSCRCACYLVIAMLAGACASHPPLSCLYQPVDGDGLSNIHAQCATYTDTRLVIANHHLRKMHFDADGLATTLIDGQWFYVKRDGSSLAVITYDNGADDFSEGLVRGLRNGKVAYFNNAFKQVIAPKYDWGWPFRDGHALVCSGCSSQSTDSHGHTSLDGGVWGYIGSDGREVVPVRLSPSEAATR